MAPVLNNGKDIILFDGVCNFCNSYVNYVIAHDKYNRFVFAPLDSEVSRKLAADFKTDFLRLNSVVLVSQNKIYTQSAAVLRIVNKLHTVWRPLAYLGFAVPPFIRNYAYRAFAGKRYALFGRADTCMIPDTHIKSKFLV